MLFPISRRQFDPERPELVDLPSTDTRLLEVEMRNIRTVNRRFGGLSVVRKHILPMFARVPDGQAITILDLATGSGDHPVALCNLARAHNRKVNILALDRHPFMVEISRKLAGSFPQIVVKQGDILDIDLPDKSMDIVLCSLTIHHFSDQDAVQLLKTMARISRIGIIVNDLQRNWIAASSAWLYTHLTTRNPLTLNDAYVSVRRAFTPQELTKLADSAGFRRLTVSCEPLFRLVLAGEP